MSHRYFRDERAGTANEARQVAAFFIMSGIDLDAAVSAPENQRKAILLGLRRLLERERLRGGRKHWSYDLNRHIALSQALCRLENCSTQRA